MATSKHILILLFYFYCSRTQNTASLVIDSDLFPTQNQNNRDLFRANAGVHLSVDNKFILVVNERETLNPNDIYNNIVSYVIQQDYTAVPNIISTKPRTAAYASAIDNSNSLFIFGTSTDIENCSAINSGTGKTGFVMKFSSFSSPVAEWCRTTVGLSLVIRMTLLGPYSNEYPNGVVDASGEYIYFFGNTKLSNEVSKKFVRTSLVLEIRFFRVQN